MIYHGKVIGPGGRIYQCEHNHRTETAAITCAKSSRTRQMAALAGHRAAVQEAQAAELARKRIEAKEAVESRRAAAQVAAEQAKAEKRAAKLAAMPPNRAWKQMTPVERLLRTADLEIETYGEIRSPDAKAAYDARAAKPATPRVPPSSNSLESGDNAAGAMQPGGRVSTLEQRNVQARKQPAQGAMGCLLLILVIVIVIIAVVVHIVGSGPSGPALTIMKNIPGCTNITTNGGNSLDDNTVSEGSCQLADGTNVSVYVWFAGDISDQHDYAYQNASNCVSSGSSVFVPDGCFVGSNPQPWFIDVATSNSFSTSGAESDWAPVENGLAAIQVTNVPLSWCSTICSIPGQPSGGGDFSFGDGD
ncbi:MAG TPA: hypothetical protein VMV92_20875 [Streptosporangiaceae bacterium]|nr:hypothetical protein [Streptosporangiaceae bacterium]